jgi:hypothetical protein
MIEDFVGEREMLQRTKKKKKGIKKHQHINQNNSHLHSKIFDLTKIESGRIK